MSPASNHNVALGQNNPAPTNHFDMQMGAQTRDWEDKTVATKCSKRDRVRNTVPVEGKGMKPADTSAAGKTQIVEKVQEAVVQALATQAPAAAAFAGMHEFERGNGYSMKEREAFGAITEGKTEDNEDTAGEPDNSLRRGPNQANQFTCTLSVMFMGVGLILLGLGMLMYLGTYAGEVGSDMVTTTRAWASSTIDILNIALGTYGWVPFALLSIFMALHPAAAYSVAGIRYRVHTPAIYTSTWGPAQNWIQQ